MPLMRNRLDNMLVTRGLVESREKAKRLILAGAVRVNDQRADKASLAVADDARIDLVERERYVSRGGRKLEAGLAAWAVDCHDRVCLDIGASTGGFTDCLLQHGARKVHAVDVGKGQLDYRLRQDERVVVHDNVNARHLTVADIGETVDMITIDVSFISLEKILPAALNILNAAGQIIALIKPQFEAGRDQVGKGGVVRDPAVHATVIERIKDFAGNQLGLEVTGVVPSPVRGPAGNIEFLMSLRRPA